jgi:hypothetical protein
MTASDVQDASDRISQRIAELGDWRGEMLARIRTLIREALPNVVEEWKWMGTPVWSDNGIICTGESYKAVVKMTFAKGAALADPAGLFNSSLAGNARRAIDIRQGEAIDEAALKELFQSAAALNATGAKGKKPAAKAAAAKKPAAKKPAAKKPAARKPAAKKPAAKKPAAKKPAAKKKR